MAAVTAGAAVKVRVDLHAVAVALVFAVTALVTLDLAPWASPAAGWWVLPASIVLVAACAAVVGGVRQAGWVAVAAGVPVLAVPQWDGTGGHYHHLLWFAVVLLIGRDGPWQRCCWALFAFVYAIPGLAKLANAGHLIDGGMGQILERVRGQHDVTRWVPGWLPPVAAVAVIVGELALPVLFFTRWRRHAAVAGVGFHLSTWWVLGISFWSLWLLYPLLWWEPRDEGRDLRPVVVTAAIIVLSLVAGENGWPFAHYPHFES